jgi:hypothetical protein
MAMHLRGQKAARSRQSKILASQSTRTCGGADLVILAKRRFKIFGQVKCRERTKGARTYVDTHIESATISRDTAVGRKRFEAILVFNQTMPTGEIDWTGSLATQGTEQFIAAGYPLNLQSKIELAVKLIESIR